MLKLTQLFLGGQLEIVCFLVSALSSSGSLISNTEMNFNLILFLTLAISIFWKFKNTEPEKMTSAFRTSPEVYNVSKSKSQKDWRLLPE